MRFKKDTPKKYRFVYDVQVSPRKDYLSTYQDFGWQYLGRMASAHMWRMGYDNERPEAFTDPESLAGRTRRNIAAVSVSFFIFLVAVIAIGFVLSFAAGSLSASDRLQIIIVEVLFSLITIALGTVMLSMRKNLLR